MGAQVKLKIVAVLLLLVAAVAWAQTTVNANQGAPGTQGPWPVTLYNTDGGPGSGGSSSGGGAVTPAPCSVYKETNTSVGTSGAIVPATPLAGRIWVRIC